MGIPARHEPINMQELHKNDEFFDIFEVASWTEYFQLLSGFHHDIVLQFALNLIETHTKVMSLHIEVIEQIVAEVMGLPQSGRV